MTKKKSIKKTLLIGMIGLAASVTILSGVTNGIMMYNDAVSNMNVRLSESSTAYCQSVQNSIQTYRTKIEAIAQNYSITDTNKTVDQRNAVLSNLAKQYGFATLSVSDENGHTSDGGNVIQREHFKQSMA